MNLIQKLEKELKELREHNISAWMEYGSELCAGDMIGREEVLKARIDKLKRRKKKSYDKI